jgi:hypothetical protein
VAASGCREKRRQIRGARLAGAHGRLGIHLALCLFGAANWDRAHEPESQCMLNESLLRRTPLFAASALCCALFLQARTSRAVLDVPYGDDGAPPDSDAMAEAAEKNEQIMNHWEAALSDIEWSVGGSLSEGGICESPISLWTASESSEPVMSAILDPAVSSELNANLQEYIQGQVYLWSWAIQQELPSFAVDPISVTRLSCETCAMTYDECLQEGLGVTFCKMHYLNCPSDPPSSVAVQLPITAPFTGVVTLNGTIGYQEINEPGDLPYEYCAYFGSYSTQGFSFVGNLIVRNALEDSGLVGEEFCDHAWDWSWND